VPEISPFHNVVSPFGYHFSGVLTNGVEDHLTVFGQVHLSG